MANTKNTKKNWTAEEKKQYAADKRAEQLEMLTQAVDALTSEQGGINYLNTASKFHNYSFNNRILIAIQRPHATQVMGAGGKDGKTGWKSFGRHIVKGEKAIWILGPIMVKEKDSD